MATFSKTLYNSNIINPEPGGKLHKRPVTIFFFKENDSDFQSLCYVSQAVHIYIILYLIPSFKIVIFPNMFVSWIKNPIPDSS